MGKCVDALLRRCVEALMGECVIALLRKLIMILSIAKRIITKRMPSSIKEKAQSSIEPKAMGVNISKKMRINFMIVLIIAQSSKLCIVYALMRKSVHAYLDLWVTLHLNYILNGYRFCYMQFAAIEDGLRIFGHHFLSLFFAYDLLGHSNSF